MKSNILLPNSFTSGKEYNFDGNFNLDTLLLTPLSKVNSVIEICGQTKKSAFSFYSKYLAILNGHDDNCEILYILNLQESRYKALRKFDNICSFIKFLPTYDNILFIGSENGLIYQLDLETELWSTLEGHKNSVTGIEFHPKADFLVSWSKTEVLLWQWPLCSLSRRLKVYSESTVILAGHLWELDKLFAAFDSGIVMIWNMRDLSWKETTIKIPDGINMEFYSFSLSLNSEWLVGAGSQPLVVVYSLLSQRVSQVVQIPNFESNFILKDILFLPYTHPRFPKSLLMSTSESVIISDFVNSTIIKTLKSKHYSIDEVSISGNGFLLAVSYRNGTTKVYTIPSFYPPIVKETEKSDLGSHVDIQVLKSTEKSANNKKKLNKTITSLLDSSKWLQILDEFGEYPEKYRKHIWISVLELPRNFSLYSNIQARDNKNNFTNLTSMFPKIDKSLEESLQSTLNCLCSWSPVLSCVNVLPSLIFPFVKYFQNEPLLCFEICVILLTNWFNPWIVSGPNLPPQPMAIIEQLISKDDPELWLHFKNKISFDNYIFPLIYTALSRVLQEREWFVTWDHIFSKRPSFFLCVITSCLLTRRQSILNCIDVHQARRLFSEERWLSSKEILRRSKFLFRSLDVEPNVRDKIDSFTYIPQGDLIPLNLNVEDGVPNKIEASEFLFEIFPHLKIKETTHGSHKLKTEIKSKRVTENFAYSNREDRLKKSNDVFKKVNNIRQKQMMKYK